jgi:Mg2+-importing ATPase
MISGLFHRPPGRSANEASAVGFKSPGGTLEEIFARLQTSVAGLSVEEAARRLVQYGPNRLRDDDGNHPMAVLFRQFRSPMVLILLAAAVLSLFLGETDEAIIVAVIVLASTGLGFYQEFRAGNAVAELGKRIAVTSRVLRGGSWAEVPAADIVPGDILQLLAGSLISADAVLLDASALHIDEAALTGESFPTAKTASQKAVELAPFNRIHMGTSVRSGEGRAVVVETGAFTEFGTIATSVGRLEPETSFARGTRRFGLLMTQIMFVLVTVVLVANLLLGRPVLDSLLFAAALAVGITPELLPAIVTVTLSQGAKRLAGQGVLVRRLVAIENLGSMDVLCTDKTGTLTIGEVQLTKAVDVDGKESADVLRWGVLNSALQTAMPNPLDTAVLARQHDVGIAGFSKAGEVPYDFERKRLSVAVTAAGITTLACKGAVSSVLAACTKISANGLERAFETDRRAIEEKRLADWSNQGLRVIAVATRTLATLHCQAEDEAGMTLLGYLLFSDPLKAGIVGTVAALRQNGIVLRIISGDNRYVARHVASAIGLSPQLIRGSDLEGLNEIAFSRLVATSNVFAEITPDQKERIIAALRKIGHTVGYMGDGINDAPALRAADVGISVENAVDAAKASADVILLKRDLNVLLDGVIAGRTAFGNTIKYIAITISANFGNMISMAAASLLLPFLPMLATQILLNNLLSDLPMLAISTDRVDTEALAKPRQWDFRALMRSMVGFGLLSSVFDFLTFYVVLVPFHASAAIFQTAWFVESLMTELAVVAVMRTHKSFFHSLPSPLLTWTSAVIAALTLAVPYLPFANLVGIVPLPASLMASIVAIVVFYVGASELLKRQINLLGLSPRPLKTTTRKLLSIPH